MFNSGIRGKRASDNTGTIASQSQFIQQQYPQPNITGYSIQGTDDTALNPAGGQTVLVNGTGFASGAAVTVNGVTISPVTVVSPTQLSFTSTALAGGSYTLIVYNSTGGAAILVPGLIYSAVPTWTTAAGSIGNLYETTAINTSVVATSDSAITYSLSSGSLPSGATLYANGVITGTSPVENGSTTYTFAIKAEDQELQDTTRTFTLTINTDVVTWVSPADGTTYTVNQDEVAANVTLSATSAAGYNVSYSANTLPTGLSLAGNTISGTPTVVANSSTLLTATASTTNRSATRTINWVVQLGSDPYFYATALLLNGELSSTYWIQDSSTNNFAITVNGDTRPVAFSPYETVWSNYFDGTGDNLSMPSDTALDFGTGDFTVECWFYPNASLSPTTYNALMGFHDGNNTNSWAAYVRSNGVFIYGSTATLTGAGTVDTGNWYHFAATRNGSTIRVFLNGIQQATATVSGSYVTGGLTFRIGDDNVAGNPAFNGYISNVRIVKGTAIYTSTFTPSTTPLTAIANTSLLTCQSNRLIDNSTNNFTITKNGDVTVSNFGPFVETDTITGSGYFDGTGDYLSVADNTAFNLSGSISWCIELWVYWSTVAGEQNLIEKFTGPGGPGWTLYKYAPANNSGTIDFFGGSASLNSSFTPVAGIWYHIVVCRDNTASRTSVFINGTRTATTTSFSVTNNASKSLLIGARDGGINTINGYISNVRVVNGSAVYDPSLTTITVPTSPLTAITNTSLLTLQSRIGENNNRFVDTSSSNNIITRSGNATQGTFSPYSQTGWSGYFTGSSTSYISTPSTTILNQGQTYTVQCWIYPTAFTTSTSAVRRMYLFVKGVIYAGLSIHSDGTLGWYGWPTPAGMIVTSAAGTITTNVWQHVALVVNPGNYIRLFKNGTQVGTAGYTAAGADGSAITIGHGDTGQSTDGFIGYISNFKITLSALTGGQLDYSATPTISSNVGTSLLVLQTNRFNDTSANNLTITAAAGASIQSFSPFAPAINTPTSYSAYFDGVDDYATFPNNSTLAFGTGPFTVEFWINGPLMNDKFILGGRGASSFTITTGGYGGSTVGALRYNDNVVTSGATLIADNTWHHCAVVRNASNTVTLYVDGVSRGTGTDSTNYSTTSGSWHIARNDLGAGNWLTGSLSNLRILKGVALYTTNFTPPTGPLSVTAETSLLTCQSNTFIDNSTNNFTITTFGDGPSLRSFNPFGTTSLTASNAAYSIANVGGSMYLDGTGDFLTAAYAINWSTFGTYSLEFWVYHTSMAPGNQAYASTGSTGFTNFYNYANGRIGLGIQGQNEIASSAGVITTNQWQHVAYTYDGTTTRIYVNGVQVVSGTTGVYSNNSANLVIGSGLGGAPVYGYMSDFRIVRYVRAYLATFVPPVSPLTAIPNTTLMLNNTNSGVIDYTGKNDFETVGDTKLSTTIKKFGSASMYFDGTGDYLKIPNAPNFEFGSGNFTIEFWIYPTSNPSEVLPISRTYDGSSYSFAPYLTTGTVKFLYNGLTQINSSHTLTLNVWTHIAYVRNSNTLTIYANGTNVGSGSITVSITASARVTSVGAREDGNFPFAGYLDDVRITYGIARYTANFTPPTSAFPTF